MRYIARKNDGTLDESTIKDAKLNIVTDIQNSLLTPNVKDVLLDLVEVIFYPY